MTTRLKRGRFVNRRESKVADHFSLVFTYALLTAMNDSGFQAWMAYMKWLKARGSPWLKAGRVELETSSAPGTQREPG